MATDGNGVLKAHVALNVSNGNEWEVFVVLDDNLTETSMCCVTGESDLAGIAESADSSCCAPAAPVSLRRRS